MLKKLFLALCVVGGLTAFAGEAKAHYPYGYRPYYGNRYYGGPRVGYAGYRGYTPHGYGYGYYNYAPPVAYRAYPVYPPPGYYYGYGYGPRVGVSYVSPRVGVFVGY